MANILILSASWPFPIQKGNQKYFVTIIELLKRHGHNLTYCAIQDNAPSQTNIDQMKQYVDELFYMPAKPTSIILFDFCGQLNSILESSNFAKTCYIQILSRTTFALSAISQAIVGSSMSKVFIAKIAISLLNRIHDRLMQVQSSYSSHCQRILSLNATCLSKSISHVLLNYAHHADLLKKTGTAKKMILTHDSLSLIKSKIKDRGGSTGGRELSLKNESYLLSQANVCIAIEETEQAHFRKILTSSTNVIVVKHKPSLSRYSPAPKDKSYRFKIGFIGSNNPLNIQGIEEFLQYSWPLIIEKCPEATIIIAGPISNIIEHSGQSYANTEFMGVVDSVDTFYESVAICINPVSLGTGMKIKSIEAICHGRPLVSFPEGLAGIDTPNIAYYSKESSFKYPFFGCSNHIQFANVVIELLLNDVFYCKAASLCVNFVSTNMSDIIVYGALLRELNS